VTSSFNTCTGKDISMLRDRRPTIIGETHINTRAAIVTYPLISGKRRFGTRPDAPWMCPPGGTSAKIACRFHLELLHKYNEIAKSDFEAHMEQRIFQIQNAIPEAHFEWTNFLSGCKLRDMLCCPQTETGVNEYPYTEPGCMHSSYSNLIIG
jgi:hypothetical protein